MERVNSLLQNADNIENTEAKGYIELNLLADLVADYEERTYPIAMPSLPETVK